VLKLSRQVSDLCDSAWQLVHLVALAVGFAPCGASPSGFWPFDFCLTTLGRPALGRSAYSSEADRTFHTSPQRLGALQFNFAAEHTVKFAAPVPLNP